MYTREKEEFKMNLLTETKKFVPNLEAIEKYIELMVDTQLKSRLIDVEDVAFSCSPKNYGSDTQIKIEYQTRFWDEVEYIGIESEEEIKTALTLLITEIVEQIVTDLDEESRELQEEVEEALKELEFELRCSGDLKMEFRDDSQGWEVYELDENKVQIVFATIFKNGTFVIKNLYNIDVAKTTVEFASALSDAYKTTKK